MKIKYDKILGQIREKDASQSTGTGTDNPPQGFATWEDYFSWVIANQLNAAGTFLISGSVTWIENLDFQISPLQYQILGQYVQAPEKMATIPSNVSANPMFAVIYGDIYGNTGYILGTPAASPAIPQVNDNTQIALLQVYIPGNGTTPGTDPDGQTPEIVTEKIYDENIEWATGKTEETGVEISFEAETDPQSGTKHININVNAGTGTDYINAGLLTSPLVGLVAIAITEETNTIVIPMEDIFSWNKTYSALTPTNHIISWADWKNIYNITAHITDISGDMGFNTMLVLPSPDQVFENFEFVDNDFLVSIPVSLTLTSGIALQPGNYRVDITTGLTRNDQAYTVDESSVFNPAAAALTFTRAAGEINAARGIISLFLKLSTNWLTNSALILDLYNAAVKIGTLTISETSYFGFNPALIGVWQRLTLPVSAFSPAGNLITALKIRPAGNWPAEIDFSIDNIILQTGTTTPTITIPPHNSLSGLQGGNPALDEFYHVSKDEYDTINEGVKSGVITAKPEFITITNVNYGFYYNWFAASNIKNIANQGWHLPTRSEFNVLINNLGGSSLAGGKLKETGVLRWRTPNTAATNSSGFTARPSGVRRHLDGEFASVYDNTRFWSSEQYDAEKAYFIYLAYNLATCVEYNDKKQNGIPIRLIKDSTSLLAGETGTYKGNDGKLYRTIVISDNSGNNIQEWLTDNLCETQFRDQSLIPGATFTDEQWLNLTTPAYCFYLNDEKLAFEGKRISTPILNPITNPLNFSATPAHNFTTSPNAAITLTADVTTYSLYNVPDGGKGTIAVIQDGAGGFGIAAIAHAGLTVQYLAGQPPTAENINSAANGHTLLIYERIGAYIYISFAYFNTI